MRLFRIDTETIITCKNCRKYLFGYCNQFAVERKETDSCNIFIRNKYNNYNNQKDKNYHRKELFKKRGKK